MTRHLKFRVSLSHKSAISSSALLHSTVQYSTVQYYCNFDSISIPHQATASSLASERRKERDSFPYPDRLKVVITHTCYTADAAADLEESKVVCCYSSIYRLQRENTAVCSQVYGDLCDDKQKIRTNLSFSFCHFSSRWSERLISQSKYN
jgi:hypothetical protein